MKLELFYIWAVLIPFVYLYFQGRALEKLIDTADVDKMARWFYGIGTAGIVLLLFKFGAK